MGKQITDLTGNNFGRLQVISLNKIYTTASGSKKYIWECRCSCGNTAYVERSNLKNRHTQSCGCLFLEKDPNAKYHIPEYHIWRSLIKRSLNPSNKDISSYSAISVHDSWKNSFEQFFEDMGKRPSKYHSIDRIDNSKGYFAENCRWATAKQQANNRKSNRLITFNGITQTLQEWADNTGINYATIAARLDKYNWSLQDALTILPKGNKKQC